MGTSDESNVILWSFQSFIYFMDEEYQFITLTYNHSSNGIAISAMSLVDNSRLKSPKAIKPITFV